MEVVASLSQGRTVAAQCGLFTYKSVPVIFEPPCVFLTGSLGKMGSIPRSSVANMRTPYPAESFRRALSLVVQQHAVLRHALPRLGIHELTSIPRHFA